MVDDPSHPFAGTDAAEMLAAGLNRASAERHLSLRKIAKLIGIKQATVLSHMALGRMPIPPERAVQLADVLELDQFAFCLAVAGQRSASMAEVLARSPKPVQNKELLDEIAALGKSDDRVALIAEVLRDQWPRERWLEVSEVASVKALRRLRPEGFDEMDLILLERMLGAKDGGTPGTSEV